MVTTMQISIFIIYNNLLLFFFNKLNYFNFSLCLQKYISNKYKSLLFSSVNIFHIISLMECLQTTDDTVISVLVEYADIRHSTRFVHLSD